MGLSVMNLDRHEVLSPCVCFTVASESVNGFDDDTVSIHAELDLDLRADDLRVINAVVHGIDNR